MSALDESVSLSFPFQLDVGQRARLGEWLTKHDARCQFARNGSAIGGRLTICFTPTSLGTFVAAKCACGGEVGLTDLDAF